MAMVKLVTEEGPLLLLFVCLCMRVKSANGRPWGERGQGGRHSYIHDSYLKECAPASPIYTARATLHTHIHTLMMTAAASSRLRGGAGQFKSNAIPLHSQENACRVLACF